MRMFAILSCVELSKQMEGLSMMMVDDVSEANVTLKMKDRLMCLICPAGV